MEERLKKREEELRREKERMRKIRRLTPKRAVIVREFFYETGGLELVVIAVKEYYFGSPSAFRREVNKPGVFLVVTPNKLIGRSPRGAERYARSIVRRIRERAEFWLEMGAFVDIRPDKWHWIIYDACDRYAREPPEKNLFVQRRITEYGGDED